MLLAQIRRRPLYALPAAAGRAVASAPRLGGIFEAVSLLVAHVQDALDALCARATVRLESARRNSLGLQRRVSAVFLPPPPALSRLSLSGHVPNQRYRHQVEPRAQCAQIAARWPVLSGHKNTAAPLR